MGVKLNITVAEGANKGENFEFREGPIVLGRGKGDIALNDKKVSGKHCKISIEGNKVWLEDMQSTNGTFVGSKKIEEPVALRNLDVVTVGLTKLNIAIVEELEEFRKANTPAFNEAPAEDSESPNQPAATEVALPEEDAVYRETGVQRIDNMIQDELESFSKWDHPAAAEKGGHEAVSKIQVVLMARRGPEGVTQITCSEPETTIGRKGVDVRINDLDLSRRHIAIEIVGETKAYVRDLASTNGTFINGQRVSHQELNNGDLLQIGQSVFEVQIRQLES